ncbi:MAG: PKD domain-containing protein, partial [Salinivirgaceae bacterium]|nr:PKD domain-containing protein [Salinivirgaceae bacterium]
LEHWNWNFGDSQESMEQNPSHVFSDILQYSVSLTVTDNYGCSDMHDTLLTVVDIMNQPQPFTLIAPANNFLTNNTNISFNWNSSQNAHYYQVEVATDGTFQTLLLDSTLFETTMTLSLDAEQYFWRVTAKNYCNDGFTSTTHRFTTGILQLQPGLISSYSASDGLSTDMENRVSSWSDGTENGFDATQTEDNQKPLLVDNILNGNPAVQFAHNNAANYLNINQIELTEDNYTIIAVIKPEQFDLPVHYLLSGGTPTTSDGGVFAGGTLVQGVGLFDGNNTLRGNNNSTDWQLIVIQNDTIFINGYEIDYGAYSLLSDLKINLLGSRTNALNTQYFNGYLTDLLIYNTKLSKTERSEAENYLRYKYFPPINLGSDQLLSCGSCNVLLEAPDYYNQYLWSTGETTSQITVSQTGNYWVSVTDIFGFTSIDTLFIQCPSVSCYPEVDLGDDIIVPCGTCDVTLSAHADHFTEYAWSTNETTSAINVNETGTYYVTATDVDGFSTTDSIYVQCPTISCDPAVNLGEDIAVEYGFCGVTLDAGNIYASYLWSTNETTPTIEVTQPGEYHVTVTDQYNYISADTIMVLYPEIELSDTVLCAGTSALLNTGLGANYQYFWSTSSMNETITISQPSDVWVIVTDSLGCSKTSKTITVQFDSSANNIAFAVNDTTLCSGNTIAIDVPETWDYSYLWNTDSTGNNITVTETGRYYVTVTSQNQCSVIDSIDVNINGIAPIIEFTAEGHCLNDTLQITDNTYTPDGSEITLKTWSLTNHGNQVIDNPQFTLSTIGEAWLTLTAETEVGCSHTDSIQITIDTIPGFTITTPTTICQGKPSILTTSNVEGEVDQWFWYFNNTTLTGQEQTYTFSTLGEQSIRVSGIGLNGCSNIDTTYIEVVEPIIPEYTLELQNPPTEYNSVSSEITFEWSYQNDTTFTQYKLEIATDDQFETIIQERTTTASQITIEIEPTTISYWRVKGYTLCNDSVTSEIRTFQLFAPNQIEGLQLWLDAAHVTLEEEKITQWNDLSPNQHAIIQNNPNNRPVIAENTINGKPIVRFNGTSTYLDGGDILNLGTNSNSIFIVAKPNASSTGYIISKSIAISQESKWGIRTNQLFYQDNIIRSIDFSVPSDTFLLYSVTNDRVSADNILHINGSFKNSVSINATHSFQTPYNFIIGAYNNTTGGVPPYPNNAYFLDGDIAEIIMYNTLLSEEERKQVENYLMNKYSEPLELGNDIVVDYGFYPTELSIPNTYRNIIWSTGEISSTVFVNKTGKYYVQANDIFGRIQTDTINVYYPNPSIENKQICVGDSVLIAFGLGMQYKYKWSTGETSDSIFFNQSGQYSVQIIDTLEYSTTTTFEVMVDEFGNTISLGNDTALCSGNRVALQTGFEEAISYL